MKEGGEKGTGFQRRETTMKQRLRYDNDHGVLGATLSNVTWPGCCDEESKEGRCRLQILWDGGATKECGVMLSTWDSDQLSSVGHN